MMLAAFALLWPVFQAVPASSLQLEVTRVYADEETLVTTLWCPAEFLEASFRETKKFSAEELVKVVDSFRSVNLFAVIAGEASESGARYENPSAIADRLRLRTREGAEHPPLAEAAVPPELRAFAAAMRPAISAALGPAGKSMTLVFFPGKDASGRRIGDPLAKGSLSLILKDFPHAGRQIDFSWKLPLGSLLPEKNCPRCAEACRGDWKFCPWDGTKL